MIYSLRNLSIVTLCLFVTNCSSHGTRSINKTPTPEKNNLGKIISNSANDDVGTHELVEVQADDQVIIKTVGTDIDAEVEEQVIPNSQTFLAGKTSKRVLFWKDYFNKSQRERFQRFINNGEEYREMIETIFTEYGLPKELYFVGLIESGYYLGAKSKAKAVGPWQFISATAKRYGLIVNARVDERRDIVKSTHAAAMYFRDLHNVFSSWELALAAYNAGEYGIIRRIMKHGTRDYYQLSREKKLPTETINYVPKVKAAMELIQNHKLYGFNIPNSKGSRYTSQLAKSTLNSTQKNHRELISEVKSSKKTISQTHTAPQYYKVKSGDGLISISRKFKTTPKRLAQLNNLQSWRSNLYIGQRLKISDSEQEQNKSKAVKHSSKPIIYHVKSGDQLYELAKIFKISPRELMTENNLRSTSLKIGQRLKIPKTTQKIYTVKNGDYLLKIAEKFNVSLGYLKKINQLNKNKVYPGQNLIVSRD